MKETVEVTGVVSFSAPADEYDRRLVIISGELGRISAFAPGARKPTSSLIAACRTFTFARFTLYPGRTAYRVVSAKIIKSFDEMSTDLEAVACGSYFMELAGLFSEENVEARELVNLLFVTMKALQVADKKLVRAVFEQKLLVINGEGPSVHECVICRKPVAEGVFVNKRHGIACKSCVPSPEGDVLCPAAVRALQYVDTADMNSLYAFSLEPLALSQYAHVMRSYYHYYVGRDLKSAALLDEMDTL